MIQIDKVDFLILVEGWDLFQCKTEYTVSFAELYAFWVDEFGFELIVGSPV